MFFWKHRKKKLKPRPRKQPAAFRRLAYEGLEGRQMLSASALNDPGFESPGVSPHAFQYDPQGQSWSYSGLAGVAANASGFTAGNPSAPQGSQVVFLQGTGAISQPLNVNAPGNYAISFQAAQRGNFNIGAQSIQVLIDGVAVDTVTPTGSLYMPYSVLTGSLTAGSHSIVLRGLATSDATALVDQINVTPVASSTDGFSNFGFENQNIGGNYQYDPLYSGWTFSGLAGISGNATGFTSGNAKSLEGSQVGFLQGTGAMSQVVAISSSVAGNYVISFIAAQRGNYNDGAESIEILVDGAVAGVVTPSGTSYRGYESARIALQFGIHTITFKGLAGTDATALIDAIVLDPQLQDTSFESATVSRGGYQYDPANDAWTFGGTAGIADNGSGFSAGNSTAPDGHQVAFVQSTGSISQYAWFTGGSVEVSFLAAQRGNYNPATQSIQLLVDGSQVGKFTPNNTIYSLLTSKIIALATGYHTITLQGMATGDGTALIDQIRIWTPTEANGQIANTGFESDDAGSGFRYAPNDANWAFVGTAGVSLNGSGFTAANPVAPQGGKVAFLQSGGAITQTITLPDGNYVLNFLAAQRAGSPNQSIQILIGGVDMGTITPSSTHYLLYSSSRFTHTGSAATITIKGLSVADATVFLDSIYVTRWLGDTSFEDLSLATGSFAYDPTTLDWGFWGTAGISANGSGFTNANPNSPDGGNVAFVQETGGFGEDVSLDPGLYMLSFQAAQRAGFAKQTIEVFLDNTWIGLITPSGTTYATYNTIPVSVNTAGVHTINFIGRSASGVDATAFVDAVSISAVSVPFSTGQFGDSSFEGVNVGSSYLRQPADSSWYFDGYSGVNASGITSNKSVYTAGNQPSPAGNQVAFLQGAGSISQLVTVSSSGTYAISFLAAQRGNFNLANQSIRVIVGGASEGTITPTSENYAAYSTQNFYLSAGTYLITFAGTAAVDATAFIDAIQLTLVSAGGSQSSSNQSTGTSSGGGTSVASGGGTSVASRGATYVSNGTLIAIGNSPYTGGGTTVSSAGGTSIFGGTLSLNILPTLSGAVLTTFSGHLSGSGSILSPTLGGTLNGSATIINSGSATVLPGGSTQDSNNGTTGSSGTGATLLQALGGLVVFSGGLAVRFSEARRTSRSRSSWILGKAAVRGMNRIISRLFVAP
ncbi:MAG TPA: hypothetical protein VG713_11125 [Pirellulales bacterium]|nr:hypothetical protein [Pirellulales bacterium]